MKNSSILWYYPVNENFKKILYDMLFQNIYQTLMLRIYKKPLCERIMYCVKACIPDRELEEIHPRISID